MQYANITSAIKIVKKIGRGCYMAKTDIKSAFRIVPLNEDQYELTGVKFDGKYYIDRNLPQGASSSCKIFETISTAIEWIARNKLNITNIIHILDDFWIAEKSKLRCQYQLSKFKEFCEEAGIPLAEEKTIGPYQVIEFVGIELDSMKMCARLPDQKIEKCRLKLESVLGKEFTTLKEIQELAGILNFACSVIYPGKTFIRRMYNLMVGKKSQYSRIYISKEVKDDIKMWLEFLSQFNGYNLFMSDRWFSNYSLDLYTDSAKSLGYGGIMGNEWFYGEWDERGKEMDITTLEFYPIVVALNLWGGQLLNLNLNIHTDNLALVHIINNQTVKNNDKILSLLRAFVLTTMRLNLLIRAHHIPGKQNLLCDLLSRQQVNEFKRLAPHMSPEPNPVPVELSLQRLLMH